MLKHALSALAFAGALASPAIAQSPAQISKVQHGHSCSGCNLFQAELSYSDLSHKNLSGSRLRQASLFAATADGTNFTGADLSVANAAAGRFTHASFQNADLSMSNFTGAYLGYANFKGAKLNGAVFGGANLEGARGLSQAQLNTACGDSATRLPGGLTLPACY